MLLGMRRGRTNPCNEAMNGLQQSSRDVRGFCTVAITWLRMSNRQHLPTNPLLSAVALDFSFTRQAPRNQIPHETEQNHL